MSNNESNNTHSDESQQPARSVHVDAQRFEPAVINPTAFAPSDGSKTSKGINIKPWSILLGSLLLVGLVVVWFLFTAKSVIVKTQPQTQQFKISGGLLFELKGHYIMRQGEYTLEAKLPGYHPIKQTITVDERQNQLVEVAFEKLPGTLTVDVGSDISADIFIDDKKVGKSGQILPNIQAGSRELKVISQRYFPYSSTIDIEGMEKHQDIEVTLKPAWANIIIETEPAGASLSSGDVIFGTTPYNGPLLQGKHQLNIALAGYKTVEHPIEITAGKDVTLERFYLEKADGMLQLTSQPSAVSVTLNGKYQGLTPITLAVAPNQSHRLSFFKDGYRQNQQNIQVPSGEQRALNVKLEANLGQVTVHADQEDALLYVDGTLMGRANQNITLTTKQHQLVVKKEGYVDYQTTVLPRSDLQQIVDIRMKTIEQAKWESFKPRLTTSLGGELKLFKPKDIFTMGASRREQGRRANEVSRRISLKRPFYLGTKEVTNAEFRRFLRHHSSGHVQGNSLNGHRQPVVNISWKQAALFCNWLSKKEKLPVFYILEGDEIVGVNKDATGYRLPTEAEWAWATRYQNGQMLKYSWGKKLPPKPNTGNFADRSGATILGFIQATYNDKHPVTAPVASYPPNSKGIFDLDGNVAEWMNDFYEVKTGLSTKLEKDPLGAEKGDYRVIRGSSWAHGTMTELRLSFRDYGIEPRNDVGFRLARFVADSQFSNPEDSE